MEQTEPKNTEEVFTEETFFEWYWSQATQEERKLFDKVESLSSMFEDMLFKPGTSTYDLIKCKSKQKGTDEWIDDTVNLPTELEYFSYEFFRFKVEALEENQGGYFNHENHTLCISNKELENDNTILHELIHLHECVINELPLYFHDIVYWSIYKDLKSKIHDLDEIITATAHLLNESSIYSEGGLHDILFLLKSFDLDIKMKYPLGTVFAYGKAEELKEYQYLDQQ